MKEVHGGIVYDVVTPDYKLARVSDDVKKNMCHTYASAKSLVKFFWRKDLQYTLVLRDNFGWRIEGSMKYYRTQRDAVYALVKAKGKPEKIK